jgi:hypothetical protein
MTHADASAINPNKKATLMTPGIFFMNPPLQYPWIDQGQVTIRRTM